MNFLSGRRIKQGRNNLVKNEEMWSGEGITSCERQQQRTLNRLRAEGHLNVNELCATAEISETALDSINLLMRYYNLYF